MNVVLIGLPRVDKAGLCSRSWLEISRATRARGLKPSSGPGLATVHTSAQILTDLAMVRRCHSFTSDPRLNVTELFVDQKARQAIVLLNAARARATQEHTLLGLALVVRRAQVNHLVKPLARVRAVAHLLRSETERRAARLAIELLTSFEAEPRSQESSQQLHETYRACCGIFPREAAALLRVLETDRVAAGGTAPRAPAS